VNGEWYEGGKFMPTNEDRPKTPPAPVRDRTPEELARIAAQVDANNAAVARLNAWLVARAGQFKDALAVLEFKVCDQWGKPIPAPETFHQSLGRQLRASGSLSLSQARYAVKAVLGRQTKKNSEAWDALLDAMTEDFQ